MAGNEGVPQELAILGVLALMAAERDERITGQDQRTADLRKTEVVLADAGMSAAQIAILLGKKANSVTKTISRARAKPAGQD